ncbi:MAG TPA: amino acid ABC transporter ATP-binding protein [Polyangia bacterium]|nr:amino acid ABC transporter ATP-binding protein [Polyangia bacterium]
MSTSATSSDGPPVIAVHELRKRRGSREVLAGIDLTVARGEIHALLGPSGGGKTTLLRCLNGLEIFDTGRIDVAGIELGPGPGDPQKLRAVRTRVGMVFQGYHLFPHLTALENIALAPVVVGGKPRAEALSEAEALLAEVGLEHRQDARPPTLSGGEQQRVAIARALATHPEALLLDEPTAALDPERRKGVLELLRRLAARGVALVLVTHEIGFAREAADRVSVLDGGLIIEAGVARTVLTSPASPRVRAFLMTQGTGEAPSLPAAGS